MTNYSRNSRTSEVASRALRLIFVVSLAILMPRVGAAQAKAYEVIHSFKGSPDGADPEAALVIGNDGVLYGTTYVGGTSRAGTVFRLTHATGEPWNEAVLHSFSGPDGSNPRASLVFGSSGALYGTTEGLAGPGTIFELAPPSTAGGVWTEATLYTVGGGAGLWGAVLIAPGGTLYTTIQGNTTIPSGTAVAVSPPTTPGGAWTGSVIYRLFVGAAGTNPVAGFVSEGGALYGTDLYDGSDNCFPSGCGVVYELTPPAGRGDAWTETTIHTFTGPPGDGAGSFAALTVGRGGVLYGTTFYGGSGACDSGFVLGCGTVFQLTPPSAPGGPWAESVIYNFAGTDGDGAAPVSSVVLGKNGVLYGTTQHAGSTASDSACPATYGELAGCGVVFELSPPTAPGGAWTERVLHSFSGENGDGAEPSAGLALSSTGVLYGTASGGGTAGNGTVFAIKP